jgi:hypothetical protein
MDDANLKRLDVNLQGFKPVFNKDTLNYEINVPHNTEVLQVKAVTSDSGATFVIKNEVNKAFGPDVKLVEGENKILIEVTSEDGTVKKYFINCKKLSASDANLKSIEFFNHKIRLTDSFSSNELEYLGIADFNVTKLEFKIELFDQACGVEITQHKTALQKSAESIYSLDLNFGFTELNIEVTSPDKSKKQVCFFLVLYSFWQII